LNGTLPIPSSVGKCPQPPVLIRICRHVTEAMQIFRATLAATKTMLREAEIF